MDRFIMSLHTYLVIVTIFGAIGFAWQLVRTVKAGNPVASAAIFCVALLQAYFVLCTLHYLGAC